MRYGADLAPSPARWLELSEEDQTIAVEEFHRRAKIRLPDNPLHVVLHVAVENQLAEGVSCTVATMERLLAGGMSRHEAIHQLAMALIEDMHAMLQENRRWEEAVFAARLEQLPRSSAAAGTIGPQGPPVSPAARLRIEEGDDRRSSDGPHMAA